MVITNDFHQTGTTIRVPREALHLVSGDGAAIVCLGGRRVEELAEPGRERHANARSSEGADEPPPIDTNLAVATKIIGHE